jgi:2-polyprenyl-6-methoxyphenol hydroxylase-like FAD-dependent oxidoreductase
MKVVCVGGGPAGLYLSILLKLRDPAHEVTVLERNPSGQTYGWGVVYWDDLLEAIRRSDPVTALGIEQRSFPWVDQLVLVEGDQAVSLGGGGYGLGRRALLELLGDRAAGLGVRVGFEHEVDDPAELDGADLVVACDGANSRLRRRHQEQFQTSVAVGGNRYVWLGTTKVFEAFTFAFARTSAGWIWAHAYAFDGDASTFIVECAPQTWAGLGFDRLGVDDSVVLLERVFARHLDGHRLLAHAGDRGTMPWRSFRTVSNRRWHHENLVLLGDAAHTTHFTIGSGTKLAFEDAIALADRLGEHRDLQAALEAYGAQRRTALLLPQRDAAHSAQWFEQVPRYAGLPAPQFATLLKQRRSHLLPRLPPRLYYRLHRATEQFGAWGRLWEVVSSWGGARYVRRRA